MNRLELRDYYRARQEAHEVLAVQAGENYIAKIHLDLAARYAALIEEQPSDDQIAPGAPRPVRSQASQREDSPSHA